MKAIVGHLDSIICGDNVDVMATFPDACIDLVVTSPPYDDLRKYGGHSWDFPAVARELTRILKPGGVIVWVVGDKTENGSESGESFRQALAFMGLGLNLHDTMFYIKRGCGGGDTSKRYLNVVEYMFVFSLGTPAKANMIRDRKNTSAGNVNLKRWDGRHGTHGTARKTPHVVQEFGLRINAWDYYVGGWPGHYENNGDHPAAFPNGLAADHILTWSNPGDVVLDPFAGSGTTLKMAKEHGRHYIGIEVNPAYVAICEKRVAQGVLPLVPNRD